MRRMVTTAMAILLAGTAMAAAADLPGKPPVHAPAPSDWSGFYVGGVAGYGSGNLGTVKTGTTGTGNLRGMVTAGNGIKGPAIGPGAVSQSGYVSGGFVGVQKQRGNMVLGIEADFGPSSLSGSSDSRGTTLSISR